LYSHILLITFQYSLDHQDKKPKHKATGDDSDSDYDSHSDSAIEISTTGSSSIASSDDSGEEEDYCDGNSSTSSEAQVEENFSEDDAQPVTKLTKKTKADKYKSVKDFAALLAETCDGDSTSYLVVLKFKHTTKDIYFIGFVYYEGYTVQFYLKVSLVLLHLSYFYLKLQKFNFALLNRTSSVVISKVSSTFN